MVEKRGLMQISRKKNAQVWIETVTYTLIGLSIIGAMMAVLIPRINEMTDKAVILQTIEALNALNDQFSEVLISSGSQILVEEFMLKKGELTINPADETIFYTLKDTNYVSGEIGQWIKRGDIFILNKELVGKKHDIVLLLNYSNYNITYYDKDEEKTFTSASTPYSFLIQNKDAGSRQINFETP